MQKSREQINDRDKETSQKIQRPILHNMNRIRQERLVRKHNRQSGKKQERSWQSYCRADLEMGTWCAGE